MQEPKSEDSNPLCLEAKEHRAIEDQINLIRRELDSASPDAMRIYEYLRSLRSMTEEHFKHEEHWMILEGYPGAILHKRDHDYLVKGLREFTSQLVDETTLSPSVGESLQSWLRFHIKRFDDAYQEFLSRRKTESQSGSDFVKS
jgi:hemerythrin-like metal-binding protein